MRRNTVMGLAAAKLKQNEFMNLKTHQIVKYMEDKNIYYNEYPASYRQGLLFKKKSQARKGFNPITKQEVSPT